jgi:uncharacterized protein
MQQKQDTGRMSRRNFLRGTLLSVGGLSLTGGGTVYYAYNIEPDWLDITYHQFKLPRLAPAFHGYRVVHISDIHADNAFMTTERLTAIVYIINTLHADIIALTGDFVTDYLPMAKPILTVLRDLRTPDGVFGVLGNHDHPAGVEWVRECLQAGNVQELNDKTHTIRRGEQMLHLVGLDDLWPANKGKPQPIWSHLPLLQHITAPLAQTGAALLLVHEPDFADVAAYHGRFDLQISGHSHGGQVRIPFYGPLVLPPLARKYTKGLYQVEHMLQYTNRGLGMLAPYIRFACRPEITVIDLYTSA